MSQNHSLVSSEDTQGRIRLLTQSIQHNDALHELATTPLLLTLIATLHEHHGGTLPNQREKLYSASVDLLMDRWEHSKIIYDPSGKPILQTESASEWFLSPRKQILEAIEELAFTVQCTVHADLGASQQSSDIEEMRLLAAFYKVTPNMNQGRVI